MKWKLLDDRAGERTMALVFATGDEVVSELARFVADQRVDAARFTGIGALSAVTLGWFDWEAREFRPIALDEQVEVVSLAGDVAAQDGTPTVHAHVTVARSDGSAHGGHLLEAHVRPTLELVLVDSPAHLRKHYDAQTGLTLIDL